MTLASNLIVNLARPAESQAGHLWVCPRCGCSIHPGQLYRAADLSHVACPTERQIAHARRMGRNP